ncbi:uncharacterized protein LOC134260107 [Saccostrea cucullata]|uniref:uncharacterized protein LOC134260107 n=1 Tax=Saccostrea cuccullata TaxID=36930 RepID=UPI002ED07A35
MDSLGYIKHLKVRQCSQCQGDTEFYCCTCQHDLCLPCKEIHVIDLEIKHHDVVIYREKYDYISEQESCTRHPERIYELFCTACELPLCVQCKKHKKHNIQDIRTVYKTTRQKHKKIIYNLRSEDIFNSYSLLTGIRTSIKNCPTEIVKHQSEISKKAKRLMERIEFEKWDAKIRLGCLYHELKVQKWKQNRYLVNIEKYEQCSDHLINRPVKFVLFLKKRFVSKIKNTPGLTQNVLLSVTGEIKIENVNNVLNEIGIIEIGRRQLGKECLLKLLPRPVLLRTVTVVGVWKVIHFSCVTMDLVWISDIHNKLILTNTEGETLHHLKDINTEWGAHTVNMNRDLIYIDRGYNIKKLSADEKTTSTLLKKTKELQPHCIYCSSFNEELFVVMYNTYTRTCKVIRYTDSGQPIQTIQHNKAGQELYSDPRYITENRNGDIIVSDYNNGVVVTDFGGQHRFSYTGPPSGPALKARGICTNALSHILVCDANTQTVQVIDEDGHFLSELQLMQQHGTYWPWSLGYDDKNYLLWVGSANSNDVFVYRHVKRQLEEYMADHSSMPTHV